MEIKQEFYYIKNFDFKSNLSLKLRWNRKYLNIFKLNSYFKKPFLADYSWSAILAFQHYSVTLHNTALTEPKKKHTDFAIRRKELLIVFLCGWPACWGPKMGYDVNRFQGEVDEELTCPICSGVLEDPLQVCFVCKERTPRIIHML